VQTLRHRFLAATFVLTATTLQAQNFQSGIYITPDNRYSIKVVMIAEGLEVTEPNGKTVYRKSADPSRFLATISGRQYGIRLAQSGVIYSFTAAGETRLMLKEILQPSTNAASRDLMPPDVPPHAALDAYNEYKAKIQRDPANTHLHAACGAAAIAKATFNRTGYRDYTRSVVDGLKLIMSDLRAANPCPNAIDEALWK
jgi:hypothetical protein